jgi:hypothetical protein
VIARRANAPSRQAVVLGESRQHDVERALQRGRLTPHRDVREDPAPGGLADEGLVLDVQDRYDRAGGLRDDPADEVERVLGALPDDHDRGVGVKGGREGGDIAQVRLTNHVVAEAADRARNFVEDLPASVGYEDAEALDACFTCVLDGPFQPIEPSQEDWIAATTHSCH